MSQARPMNASAGTVPDVTPDTSARRAGAALPALARRLAFGAGGEALQSAFHFALNIALIRLLAVHDYGEFAVIFALGSLALTYSNALAATPVGVLLPRARSAGTVRLHDSVFGDVALSSSLLAALIATAGTAVATGEAVMPVAAGAFVGAWSLRNYARASLLARRRAALVALADLSFAASGGLLCAAALVILPPEHRLAGVLAALAAAHSAGVLACRSALRHAWGQRGARALWRRYARHWTMVKWSLVGVTTSNVQTQSLPFLIAAVAGATAYAPISAGLILMAPLRVLVAALTAVLRPELAAALAGDAVQPLRRLLVMGAALVFAACIAYGALVFVAWDVIALITFGDALDGAPMPLIVGLAWATALIYFAYMLPEALLEAHLDMRLVAQATLVSAVVSVVVVTGLLLVAAPVWSMLGVIAAELVTLVWFWASAWRLVSGMRRPR
jgi:O-antigen/teichoic acid export membrane protein